MTTGIIKAARSGTPISRFPMDEMRGLLADIVVDEAFSLRCEPAPPKLVYAIINLMLQELYTTYDSWRVDEIRIAIRAGVCSQLGPMYKLSPAEFIRIMEVYHTCPMRLEALRQLRREAEKPKPEDPAEVGKKSRELYTRVALACYDELAETGRLSYYSDVSLSHVFDFLVKTGAILPIREMPKTSAKMELEKKQILEETLNLMISEGRKLEICNTQL